MMQRQSRISPRQIAKLLRCFVEDKTAKMAHEESKASEACAHSYYRHFRECIYQHLRKAPRFFGEVEIGQEFFGRNGKKKQVFGKELRKVVCREKVTVIGLFQRGGNVYTRVVDQADRETVLNFIRMVCEPEAKILTEKWRAYSDLNIDEYEHKQMAYESSFRDRYGISINTIESFWGYAKRRLKKFHGLSRSTLALHIKECEARFNIGEDEFLNFMKKIIQQNTKKMPPS